MRLLTWLRQSISIILELAKSSSVSLPVALSIVTTLHRLGLPEFAVFCKLRPQYRPLARTRTLFTTASLLDSFVPTLQPLGRHPSRLSSAGCSRLIRSPGRLRTYRTCISASLAILIRPLCWAYLLSIPSTRRRPLSPLRLHALSPGQSLSSPWVRTAHLPTGNFFAERASKCFRLTKAFFSSLGLRHGCRILQLSADSSSRL